MDTLLDPTYIFPSNPLSAGSDTCGSGAGHGLHCAHTVWHACMQVGHSQGGGTTGPAGMHLGHPA